MGITKYLHLFRPVSEGLPEKDGYYLVAEKNPGNGAIEVKIKSYRVGKQSWHLIVSWLDLDRLTTKEKATELIEACIVVANNYYQGHIDYNEMESELIRIKESI